MSKPMITASKKTSFFNHVRDVFFAGTLSQSQVDGIEAILSEWNRRGLTDLRMLGYILGTVHHETGGTFRPLEEWGKGAGKPYGKKFKYGGGPNKRVAYKTPDKLYYGRGLVQITWYEHYQTFGKILGIDLLNKPELALDMNISVQILFEGMLRGLFTTRKLSHYFTENSENWIGARGIINGADKAKEIAWYARRFHGAMA